MTGIQPLAKPVQSLPEGITDATIDNDFEWAAKNRSRILKERRARYDSRSEA